MARVSHNGVRSFPLVPPFFWRSGTDFIAGTVYIEEAFGSDGFEPDLFSTDEVIEKEWKADADRASIYKAPLPELFRQDPSGMA
jgi:hypothetical protein